MSSALTAAFQETSSLVRGWRRPLLISHTKPDGDAIGALIAISRILSAQGASPVVVRFDPIPDRYRFLTDPEPFPMWPDEIGPDRAADEPPHTCDAAIVLDTCTFNQIEPVADWLRSVEIPKLVVDHHVTRDQLADYELIDESAAATCLLLTEWFRAAAWSLDVETASALFVGIATDTGWFHHSNTDARVFDAASYLVNRGVQPYELYERLFHQERSARFRLRAAAMRRLELLCDGRLAVTSLPRSVFLECDAALADTEDLVNEPLRLGSVIVSVMLVEHGGDLVRVGLRSRAPLSSEMPDIDVAEIAQGLGGGGHRRAAGARLAGSLQEVRDRLVALMTDVFGGDA